MRRGIWIALVCIRSAAAAPPSDADLIDVAPAIPDAVFDLRYATGHNFTGKPLYAVARCELRRAVVAQLVRAAKTLRADGRRLLIWDCYRPASVQGELWKRVHDPRYAADPKVGSRHSRGDAVDSGSSISMVTWSRCRPTSTTSRPPRIAIARMPSRAGSKPR